MTCQVPSNNFKKCFDRYKKRFRDADGKCEAVFRAVPLDPAVQSASSDHPFRVDGNAPRTEPLTSSGDIPTRRGDNAPARPIRTVPSSYDDDLDAILEMHEEAMQYEANRAAMQSSSSTTTTRSNVNTNNHYLNNRTDLHRKDSEDGSGGGKVVESTPFAVRCQGDGQGSAATTLALTLAEDGESRNTIELSDSSPIRPVRRTARKRPFVLDDDEESGGTASELSIKPPCPTTTNRSARTRTSTHINHTALKNCDLSEIVASSPAGAATSHSSFGKSASQVELLEENYNLMTKICTLLESAAFTLPPGVSELLQQRRQVVAQIQHKPKFDITNPVVEDEFCSANSNLEGFEEKYQPPCKRRNNKSTPIKIFPATGSRITDYFTNSPHKPSVTEKNETENTIQLLSSRSCFEQFGEIHDSGSVPLIEDNFDQMISESDRPPAKRRFNDFEDIITLSEGESELDSRPLSSYPTSSSRIQTQNTIDLDEVDMSDWEDAEDELTSLPSTQSTFTSGRMLNQALCNDTEVMQLDLNRSVTADANTSSTPGSRFFGLYQNDGHEQLLKSKNLPHSKQLIKVFHQVFGLKEFRTNQLEAINAALLGNDVFVLMPTGGGKSLCYQLPAMVSPGVTVVISPLRSLILDQTTKMNSKQSGCAAQLTADLDSQTVSSIYSDLRSNNPTIKILFVTPEKVSASGALGSLFDDLYRRNRLARFVIDEAHCVSQWGHDFRPDYKKLSVLRQNYDKVPLIALTATATQKVRLDIAAQLGLRQAKWFMQSFNRNNLKFEVRPKNKDSYGEIVSLLSSDFFGKTGIIYCLSRNDCDGLAEKLQREGFATVSYHAGLSDAARRNVQEEWIEGRYNVVVATIAFGMGIDKADVRFVIHHSMPKSVEGYYQEVGRAGRDGQLAHCILYYSPGDFNRWKKLLQKTNGNKNMVQAAMNYLYDVQLFCLNKAECRRKQLLKYFGEQYDERMCITNIESVCDNCLVKDNYVEQDLTQEVKVVLESIRSLVGPYGANRTNNISQTQLINILVGSNDAKMRDNHRRCSAYGFLKHLVRTDVTRLVQNLIALKYLGEDTMFNKHNIHAAISYLRLGERASDILLRGQTFKFSVGKKKASSQATSSAARSKKPSVNGGATTGTTKGRRGAVVDFEGDTVGAEDDYSWCYRPPSDRNAAADDSMADFIVNDSFEDYQQENSSQPRGATGGAKKRPAPKRPRTSGYFGGRGRGRGRGGSSAAGGSRGYVRKTKETTKRKAPSKSSARYNYNIDDDGFIQMPD